jgi:hypothetical protein
MNIGIVVGVSQYSSKPGNLPACKKDVECVSSILRSTNKFDEIVVISEDTRSTTVKTKLTEFIKANKDAKPQEVFFYYTGHGEFIGSDFYYLLSDFNSERRKQTSLENSELDNLLRSLKPELAVKIVDACQSGVPYIKDMDSFNKYLKGTQETFKNCYFLFSSLTEQSSYQDDNLSFFTRAFAEAIFSHPGPTIRYKDIIDYVSERFEKDATQTPFFIVQADFTDEFCGITESVRNALKSVLVKSNGAANGPVSSLPGASLIELVREDSKDYYTEQEVKKVLVDLFTRVKEVHHPQEATELFEVDSQIGVRYEALGDMSAIGQWFQENKQEYFAKVIFKKQVVEAKSFISFYSLVEGEGTQKPRKTFIQVPTKIRPTIEMPYSHIIVQGKPKYTNLNTVALVLVPFVSQTHVRFFTAFCTYRDIGWDHKLLGTDVNWSTMEMKLKDEKAIGEYFNKTVTKFWDFALEPIKKKFGLLPQDGPPVDSEGKAPMDDKAGNDKKIEIGNLP